MPLVKANPRQFFSDRRQRARSAPSFGSRKGQKIVKGLTKAELVRRYGEKVRLVAYSLAKTLPASIEVDDLISMGFMGLMDAADKYDPNRDTSFETYAEYRIRGTILDELRKQDWVPRSARERAKQIERAADEVTKKKGRPATEKEIGRKLGLTVKRVQKLKREVGSLALVSFEQMTELRQESVMETSAPISDPYTEISRKDAKDLLDSLMQSLSEEERIALRCYYFRELTLKEIGAILELTESRVSQIHGQAIIKLRELIKAHVPSVESLFVMLLDP